MPTLNLVPTHSPDKTKLSQCLEINIPLLDAIKQIPKYAKFFKELCVHKRKKMKRSMEIRGVVSALIRNENFTEGPQALPKKCRDPRIFSVPCTIDECTFADAMLDLGASINVMPTSIYKALNCGNLEPTGIIIQLANRSVVQPLGVLEDVLVQVDELIFPVDFYVLDMEDETPGKGSTLILGRPFLMTARTKIDVHAGMLSMEFGDTLVQNIFEAMKHPTEDHSLFGIDVIEELVEEYFQLDSCREDMEDLAKNADFTNCLRSTVGEANNGEVHDLSNPEDEHDDVVDLDFEAEVLEVIDQGCNHEDPEAKFNSDLTRTEYTRMSRPKQQKAELMSTHLMLSLIQVSQSNTKSLNENSSSLPPPMELKPLPNHLKYAYLDTE
ncbi:hypothetical protein CR513_38265, partial [Mucuna pruriens]